jgi:hypothetical protein
MREGIKARHLPRGAEVPPCNLGPDLVEELRRRQACSHPPGRGPTGLQAEERARCEERVDAIMAGEAAVIPSS